MVALSQAPVGKTQEVKWVSLDRKGTEAMEDIGIRPGSMITVMNFFLGGVIVAVNNMRYAMDSELAYRIKIG